MARLLVLAVVLLGGSLAGWRALAPDGSDGADGLRQRARVVRVIDGDTIKVTIGSRRETVRLIGVDTPELHRPGTPVECGARPAERLMRRLALAADGRGRTVTLVADPTQDRRDRYGRMLAYVEGVDGTDLGEAELRDGWGEVYVFRGRRFQRLDRYRSAAAKARSERRGVWRSCAGGFHSAR
jgi:micrococcal nuclease